MPIDLTVAEDGQVILRRDILDHLGAGPGDHLDVELLPGGRIRMRARPNAPVSSIFGLLKRDGQPPVPTDAIRDAAAAGWAGER